MKYFWSLVLISVGAVLLGASAGLWESNLVWGLWRFWPLAIIFAGLSILTYDKKWGPIVMIFALLISGFFIYDAVFSKNPIFIHLKDAGNSAQITKSDIVVDVNESAKSAKVNLDMAAVEINVDGITDKLMDGKLSSNIFTPVITDKTEAEVQKVNLSAKSNNKKDIWLWTGGIKNKLNVAFSERYPLDLTLKSGASTLNLNLKEYILSALTIDAGASTIDLKIGDKVLNGAKLVVDAGASTIKITLPKEIGVRIKLESGLSTKNLPGFTQNGDYYENEAYKTAEKKIDLELKAGVSTIDVIQY